MLPSSAATASSTTYWIAGLSTTGNISFGVALVVGRNRVPSPAAGMTAFVTGAGGGSGCGVDDGTGGRDPVEAADMERLYPPPERWRSAGPRSTHTRLLRPASSPSASGIVLVAMFSACP